MATKSRKYKSYQTRWKVCMVILLFISALLIFLSGVIFTNISKNWRTDALYAEDFYDTLEFRNAVYDALDDVVLADVFYESEAKIKEGEKIDREALIEGFKRYYGIIDGVITGSTEINDTYDGLEVHGIIPPTLESNFLEYQELVESRLPQYREIYIQNQLDDYRAAERALEDLVNFRYFVEDENGNILGGNATRGEVSSMDHTIMLSREFSSDNLSQDTYYPYSNYYLENSNYRVYAAVKEPLEAGDRFYDLYQDFRFARASLPYLFGVSIVSCIVFLFCLIYLIRVAGQREKGGEVTYLLVDRMYNEVHFLLVGAFALLAFFAGFSMLDTIYMETMPFWSYVFITLLGLIYIASVAVGLSYILSVTRQIKGRRFFRNTLVSALIRKISSLFTGTTFRGWMVLVMLAYGMGNGVLVFFMCMYWYSDLMLPAFLALVAFNVFCLYLFLRALRSLKKIMISARETSKGNLAYQLDLAEISPSFLNFAEDIANIQDGLKNAVEEAVKGERMKTELITNVSHDLKTPLTSIITYVDLLKQEKLVNTTAKGYVEILYEKSYRLKQLIEDLIEASKASSGNVKVVKMRVDFHQLVMQAVGEMEEKIESSGLQVKLSCPEPVYIDADGRHMWRILENLLSNAAKYSMPNSRVYVDIFRTEEHGILVMKNVSAAPIDFDATRLTERFVRGDSSRTTEGSGLGLSITQSLTELQGGTFGIQVDGDLFKAIVSMPLWITEEDELEEEEETLVQEEEPSEADEEMLQE
ncbi:sensor histidine kinase [Anaerotignum lactatifermentans]|uniref:histidine kinase n=1 Tax=Anaerotignum lactatifermentans TaxID=160404 RepID=A0ABS2G7X4_9FIRM|nr:histidine kinase dimerization/phospho-acceptor domain-containing protein [Anaerotignum lactatifermentans]MBM6828309.1 sensor histidine kinase [Anaerotignum lactatifermentans]MBM6877589.1 sensor histidine kinase [Anaerotignum lactatifermentans]MBM6949892.1 sensor histidine kinase [Anaerotignum lactatifermentans]